jgi:hypothetical protein
LWISAKSIETVPLLFVPCSIRKLLLFSDKFLNYLLAEFSLDKLLAEITTQNKKFRHNIYQKIK